MDSFVGKSSPKYVESESEISATLLSSCSGTSRMIASWIKQRGTAFISSSLICSRRLVKPEIATEQKPQSEAPLDTETIFKLRPDLREDDKEIVKFLFENGGEAKESELRKKFLQPRTTMWRAVKRLERLGIIEIQKKDMQNLVKLTKNLEEEEWKASHH